ncbi:hypothetical protein [Streptomyces sp. NPDC052693]|uniref:hypothetical protein n=1 Tax=Streptomyces sp. NPDC052693 TaxID=3155814 RepID=UPI003442B476
MFKPFEYADGATDGGPQGVPNVYVPQGAPPPEYDAYADPAAAHGWQDVYEGTPAADGTAVGDGAATTAISATAAAVDGRSRADGRDHTGSRDRTGGRGRAGGRDRAGGAGDTRELPAVPAPARSGGGHRSRRKPPAWRTRRVAMAAGAVGAVSAAALIAGFSFSGGPSGGPSGGTRSGEGGRTASTAGEVPTASPPDGVRASSPGAPLDAGAASGDRTAGAGSAAPSAPVNVTPSSGGADTPEPSAGSPTADAPTTSAPAATTPPGRSDGKPGHGPGGTKGPK